MPPRDFGPTFNVIAADIQTFLENEPEAIDAILFRAQRSNIEQIVDQLTDLVGTMEASEREIEYDDADDTKAYELPIEFPIEIDEAGQHGSDYSEEPRAMLISGNNIPKGSVLVYDEYEGTEVVRRIFYVASTQPISKHPGAGLIYFMLPFLDFDERFLP